VADIHVTEAESEILGVLWRLGPVSFFTLIDEVKEARQWSDSTVKTLLGRLMRKNLVKSVREDGRQLYHPQITRKAYIDAEVQALADRLFGGDRAALARHLNAAP
jgi:BlaI family penicillinase repressor